ncbi:hypothetical protein [Streptomyces sp. CRN 30]|uniref:hypothetical protein n=1 Tax=Streptomyces sp. CRN 30 TaxID=3075613 RepID=UPI002A802D7E|nr:hypothetical protein [Streptomyces sp. CRN 30]
MSKRQTRKMLQLMATGEPVEVTSAMASVTKLARLAYVAQQFGYEYADVRQGSGHNSALRMLIVPDPSPRARERAARTWAQYPNAGDGTSLPPAPPDALELLKARINFDLTGRSAERRVVLGALGLTVGMVIGLVRVGEGGRPFVLGVWGALMAVLGIGFLVNRKRNARFAARLRAAGFVAVTDERGRVRQVPPGGQLPGHGNPFAAQQQGQYQGHQPGQYHGQPYGSFPQQPNPYQQPGPYGYAQPNPYQQPSPYQQQPAPPPPPPPAPPHPRP